MIQRIQSLWLLLAAIVIVLCLKFPFGGAISGESKAVEMYANEGMPLFILTIVLSISAFVIIFLYRKRSNQKRYILLSILLAILLLVLMYFDVESLKNETTLTGQSFKIGVLFPVLYVIFLILAYAGIKKDEALIKSLKRLR